MMRFLSVCSGIEAASVAWKPLGWTCAGVSEIEAFPRAVLQQRFGATPVDFEDHRHRDGANAIPLFGDFTQIEEHHVGAIDLIVGGTPCQDYSIAGLRAGLDGDRGNLTLEFSRLAYRTGAGWLVWENVPGAFSTNEGRDFGAILATFSGRHGLVFEPPATGWGNAGVVEPASPDSYGLAWRVCDAQYFGVPQRRRRIFIVGYIGDWRPAAAVLLERESMRGDPAPRREKGQVSPTIPSRSLGGGGLGTDFECDGGLISERPIAESVSSKWAKGTGGPAGDECQNRVAHTLRGEGFDASEDGTGRGTPLVPAAAPEVAGAICRDSFVGGMGGKPEGAANGHFLPVAFPAEMSGTQFASTEDLSPALSVAHTTAIAFKPGSSAEAHSIGAQEEVACTLEAGGGGNNRQAVAKAAAVRRLTPRECERLQGFPDDFTRIAWRGRTSEDCPDGPRYKALGNSMAVPVMRWIGERIAAVEAILTEAKGGEQ